MRLLPLLLILACASAPPEDQIAREIQSRYDQLEAAFEREDIDAVLAFRTPDYYSIGPDGRRLEFEEMAEYSRNWFRINEPPIDVDFTVRGVEMLAPDVAAVTVYQEASRMQMNAGQLRKVNHNVVQRETWVRTGDTWKIRTVDRVRDQRRWIDGKRVDPTVQYDPNAPEFTEEQATRREIEQRYRNLATAYLRQDIDTIAYFYASPMAETIRRQFANEKPAADTRFTVRDVRIVSADEVVADVVREPGAVAQKATWVRTPDGWKIRAVD